MPLRNVAWLLVVPAIVALGLAVSYSAPAPDKDYKRVRQLVDVMAEVDANFYRSLTDEEWQQFIDDMINGGLRKLDPNSEYLSAKLYDEFKKNSEGSFGGIGIVLAIDPTTKFLKVGQPLPGTPAYEAGIIAGDLIVKVGDQSTENLKEVDDARKVITGEPGTKVQLTIRRAGRNPTDEVVELTRAAIPQHPVYGIRRSAADPAQWDWFADKAAGIGYIRIGGVGHTGFNQLTAKELKAAIELIEKEGGKGLIIDLRDNPGGLLNQAIDVSNLFLPDGAMIVSTRPRNPDHARHFKAKKDAEIFKPAAQRPVVVLVNDGSASASEIVAAALQDNQRATIVGERTFGKGTVQKPFEIPVGDKMAAVKITTETYWRPNGQNMDRRFGPKDRPDEWGVKPDIEVVLTKEERLRSEWELLKAHWVAGKPSVVGANPPSMPMPKGADGKPLLDDSKPFEDRQLKAAIDVLKKKLGGVGAAPPVRRLPEPVVF
jgi:carboxyl-terminal processing protease